MIDISAVLALIDEGKCTQQEAMIAIGAAQLCEYHPQMFGDLDATIDLGACEHILDLAEQPVPWRKGDDEQSHASD